MHYIKNAQVLYVGQGFSFFAFIFSWGWLLARGLWAYGIFFMLIHFPLWFYSFAGAAYISGMPGGAINWQQTYLLIPNVLLLFVHLLIGFKGNKWRQALLEQKGYKLSQ